MAVQKSFLSVQTEGVRGGKLSVESNKASVTTIIDHYAGKIIVDAFQGSGENYKRRERSLIRIKIGEVDWSGTAEELAQIFRDASDIADDIHADIEAGLITEEDMALENYKEFSDKYRVK